MRPIIIEFLGTQGSGKTTLLPAVVAFFKEQGIQAQTVVEAARPYARRTLLGRLTCALVPVVFREQLLWQIYYQKSNLFRMRFNRKNRWLVHYVEETQRTRPVEAGVYERRILFWFSRLCGTYAFLEKYAREKEAIVFDDGFVHRAVHLNASPVETPRSETIAAYLSRIPLPDLLIVPRAPIDVCIARVTSRGIWDHFRGRTQDELRQYLANSEFIVNTAVDELRKRGCLVIEVDNSQSDMRKIFSELHEQLKTIQLSLLPS